MPYTVLKKALRQRGKFNPSKHPFYNDLVLRKLFCYMPKDSLLACRLVCKTWQNASMFCLQNDTLQIPSSIFKMRNLSNCIKRSANWPLKTLVYDTEGNSVQKREFALNSVIIPVSKWITELHLHIYEENRAISISSTVLEFPHLQKFICSLHKSAISTFADGINLFRQILEASPGLKSLEIRDDAIYGESCGWVFSVLKVVKAMYSTKNIPSLTFSTAYSPIYMLQIGELGLQLEHLSLTFCDNGVPTFPVEQPEKITRCPDVNFIDIFEPYASSLVSLKLTFDYIFQDATPNIIRLAFPRMEKLEKLEIVTRRFLRMSCDGFSYSEQFPKLKHLAIDQWTIPRGFINCFEFMRKSSLTVTTISTITFESDYLERKILSQAWSLFPNVKSIIVSIRHVDVVCKYWQNLTELTLIAQIEKNSCIHINSMLTGLDEATFIKLENMYKKGRPLEIIWKDYQKLARTGCSAIMKLKKLAILKLKTGNNLNHKYQIPDESQEISPLTCELILLKMESLKCVDFCGNSAAVKTIPGKILNNMRKSFQVLF